MLNYPNAFPSDAVKIVVENLRGGINVPQLANAIWNLIGYALYLGIPYTSLFGANLATSQPPEEIELLCKQAEGCCDETSGLKQAIPPGLLVSLIQLAILLLKKH